MKTLDRLIETPLDFSKGMWWHNVPVELGTGEIESFGSDTEFRQTTPDGYFDQILNFDFDNKGRLVSRPPVVMVLPNTFRTLVHFPLTHRYSYATEGGFAFPFTIAWFKDAATSTMKLAKGWVAGEDFNYGTSYSTADATIYGTNPNSAVYYNGFWYVYCNGTTLWWVNDQTSVFGSGAVPEFTVGTGMRRALIWKDRAFGIGGNKLFWSKATDPAEFTPPDGGSLQLSTKTDLEDIIVFNDRLWILDRNGRVWTLDYNEDPADGSVVPITQPGDLGRTYNYNIMTGGGISNFAVSNGTLFVCDVSNVYAIINNRLIPIGDPLNMTIGGNHMIDIWDIGHGLLAVVHTTNISATQAGGWSRYFVYHHNQNAWTEYNFHIAAQSEGQSNREFFPTAVANMGGASLFFHSWKNSSNDFVYPLFLDRSPVDEFGGEHTLDKIYFPLEGNNYITQTPLYKLKSGVTYLDNQPAKYKKLKMIQMNGYLRGPATSYHSWQIRAIPNLIVNTYPARMDEEYLVDPETNLPDNINQGAGYTQPYQRLINQRLRGLRFDWSYTAQDATTNARPAAYLDRVMIEGFTAWWTPVGKRRDADITEISAKSRTK